MTILHPNTPPDTHQLAVIAAQLGRAPRGIQALAASDANGTPLVLRMSAIIDGKPFPTLYWLSCERLKIELAHLETAGVIKTLEARLQEDDVFLRAYHDSHRDYVAQRWRYMSHHQQAEAQRLGYTALLRQRGIGGIGNWDQVRCLHTQYAHHLCGHNVIGQWLDAEYGIADGLL